MCHGATGQQCKTVIDVGRSLGWAIVRQIFYPLCAKVFPLQLVGWETGSAIGFTYEHQGNLLVLFPETNPPTIALEG